MASLPLPPTLKRDEILQKLLPLVKWKMVEFNHLKCQQTENLLASLTLKICYLRNLSLHNINLFILFAFYKKAQMSHLETDKTRLLSILLMVYSVCCI